MKKLKYCIRKYLKNTQVLIRYSSMKSTSMVLRNLQMIIAQELLQRLFSGKWENGAHLRHLLKIIKIPAQVPLKMRLYSMHLQSIFEKKKPQFLTSTL